MSVKDAVVFLTEQMCDRRDERDAYRSQLMRETNDNQLVFTLPEALSEIRALREQKTALLEAIAVMRAYVEPHPSWESERRWEAANKAAARIRSEFEGNGRE